MASSMSAETCASSFSPKEGGRKGGREEGEGGEVDRGNEDEKEKVGGNHKQVTTAVVN